MKKLIILTTILLSIMFISTVNALKIDAPYLIGVEYIDSNSVRVIYNANNDNVDYTVQIYNMTIGKFYKNTIPSSDFIMDNLETNKTYNLIMRVYYGTDISPWSNIISVTPKEDQPVINSVAPGDKQLVLNYKVSGTPAGVEVLNTTDMSSVKTTNLTTYTMTNLINDKTYKIMIRTYYDNNKNGPWSNAIEAVPKKVSNPTPTPTPTKPSNPSNPSTPSTPSNSTVEKAKSYSKIKILKTYNTNNMKKIADITAGKGMVPQSFCNTGSKYVVQFVKYPSDSYGKLIAYTKGGSKSKTGPSVSVGHGNGLTYNSDNGKIYSVRGNKKCAVFNSSTLKKEKTITLPYEASGIAYDSLTKRYYLGKGSKVHVLDNNFKYIKTITKKRTLTAQDIGAYQGVALVIAWHANTKKNYIDLYRISDKAYLGSYYLPMNEVESVFIDDGYLVIIRNIQGTNKDYIYKTKNKISFP